MWIVLEEEKKNKFNFDHMAKWIAFGQIQRFFFFQFAPEEQRQMVRMAIDDDELLLLLGFLRLFPYVALCNSCHTASTGVWRLGKKNCIYSFLTLCIDVVIWPYSSSVVIEVKNSRKCIVDFLIPLIRVYRTRSFVIVLRSMRHQTRNISLLS